MKTSNIHQHLRQWSIKESVDLDVLMSQEILELLYVKGNKELGNKIIERVNELHLHQDDFDSLYGNELLQILEGKKNIQEVL